MTKKYYLGPCICLLYRPAYSPVVPPWGEYAIYIAKAPDSAIANDISSTHSSLSQVHKRLNAWAWAGGHKK